jgi:predicted sugar kinase
LAHEGLIPAAIQADWQLFSDSLFEFSQLAGSCFAEVQGGDYNGESITELVRFLREIGLPGVGQTSWGPTVFALAVSQSHAEEKMMEITDRFEDVEIIVSAPDNRGVEVVANRLSRSCVPAPTTR